MLEHPWFSKNPALWPVAPSVLGQTLQMEGDIYRTDYKVISKNSPDDKVALTAQ